jgi:polyhydroxyalkanoate synthesis regulator phasin
MGGDVEARDAMSAVDDLETKHQAISQGLEDAIKLQDQLSRNLADLQVVIKQRLDKLEQNVVTLQHNVGSFQDSNRPL